MTERLQIASFLGKSRLRIHRLGGELLGFWGGSAKFLNDARQFLEQVIHLSIGGIFAEAEPHCAHGVLGRETHGNEHMAGSHGASGAGRATAGTNTFAVEQEQDCLGFAVGKAQVAGAS